MKNNKGFTLIELLAVILILAVIALIAVPVVNRIVKEAKKGAAEASAVNYIDAVEKVSAKALLDEDNSLSLGTLEVSFLNPKVDISGTIPLSGNVTLDSDGIVTTAVLCLNNYVVNYIDSKAKVDETKNCEDETTTAPETQEFLNGAEPVLGTGMIPVLIASDGTVTYADTDELWYDYENKVWANTVILSNGTYNVGDVIPESAIKSYFVWIPRYKYKLWNTGTAIRNAHSIEIVFENKTTPLSTGTNNGDWLTHPAFTSLDVNGIWVGKYETGYLGATTAATAQVTSLDSSKIIVKPNVYSWRSNTVYNIFVAAYNYNRTNDSHMMKNTEWGAVAYLSHSDYGIDREVKINNNSSYKTGYSALASTNQHTYPGASGDGVTFNIAYNTIIGYLASTTGNISGIYDMVGGSHEYMASYKSGQLGSSGFNTTTISTYNSKYFDVYSASSTVTGFSYRILGDATGEMGPFFSYLDGDGGNRYHNSWYADGPAFVDSTDPWFGRGGTCDYGSLAGQFSFSRYTGGIATTFGSRLVLAP